MIKLKIERYRDFTEEENKAHEEWKQRNNRYGMNDIGGFTQAGIDKYFENAMDVEITNEQFEAIRKAVLENF
jgi:hypothetical protein